MINKWRTIDRQINIKRQKYMIDKHTDDEHM